MSDKVRTSGCICGEVQLRLTGEPIIMGLCHCDSCRRWLGAPAHASALWHSNHVEVVRGAESLSTYKRTPDTGSIRKFCKSCGAPVLIDHPPTFTDIPAVSITDLEFKVEMHTNYAEKFISVPDGQPKYRDFHPMVGGTGELLPE